METIHDLMFKRNFPNIHKEYEEWKIRNNISSKEFDEYPSSKKQYLMVYVLMSFLGTIDMGIQEIIKNEEYDKLEEYLKEVEVKLKNR